MAREPQTRELIERCKRLQADLERVMGERDTARLNAAERERQAAKRGYAAGYADGKLHAST